MMFNQKKFGWLLVVLLLVVPMVLVACGGDDDDDNGGDDVGELNQTIESGGLTVQYPEDWAARVDDDDGSILIANNEEILDRVGVDDEGPQSGEFGAIVMATPLGDMGGVGAREAFDMMAGFMSEEGGGEAEVSDITVGDREAYRADVTPEDGTDGFIIGFEADGALVLVVGVAAEGEIDDYEDVTLDIAESVEYSAPADE